MRERTIFLHGFSKAFAMTGWRVGYACGPAEIIDAMMKIHQYGIMSANTTSQEAALEALRNGTSAMLKMRESYRERRNVMVKMLNDMGLKCVMPQGAFYAFPNIESFGIDSHSFCTRLLHEGGVAAAWGTSFGSYGEGHFRLSFANSLENLKIAVDRIAGFAAGLS
jgi:aminotransferase